MENTVNVSRNRLIIKWGLIMGLSIFALSFIGRLVGLEGNSSWGITSFILSAGFVGVCMTMATKTYRDKAQNGFIGFSRAFSTSFYTGMVATLAVCIFTFIALQIAGDEFKAEMEKNKMETLYKMEQDGADEKAIEMSEKIFDMMSSSPVIVGLILIMYTIGSVIIGLIVAAIVKKEDPNNIQFPVS